MDPSEHPEPLPPPRVSLAGLGNMGIPIAERILAAGYPLLVYNRTPGRDAALIDLGARRAESPAALLAEADIGVSLLANDAAVEEVLAGPGGVLSAARPGSVLVEMSTISPAASARIAEKADAAGVHYLRAPVSGNPGVVRAGNLTVIVSGPDAGYALAEGLIRAIGPNVFRVGAAEEARVVKLALQVMIAGTSQLMAEALVLAESAGVPPATLLEVMGNSAVGSPFVKYKTGPLLAGDYAATFTVAMMDKDIDLVLELGEGVELPLTGHLKSLLDSTVEAGFGDLDMMAVYLALRSRGATHLADATITSTSPTTLEH